MVLAWNNSILYVGDKVWLGLDKRPFIVRASNERWAICTKPFNLKRTVLYSIVDFKEHIYGKENTIFEMGAETDQECIEMLERLTSGESEISRRNRDYINLKYWKILRNIQNNT